MIQVGQRMRGSNAIGTKGSVVWRDVPVKASVNPETCHCGATALYREGDKGFCKAHHADAVAAAKKTSRRGEL